MTTKTFIPEHVIVLDTRTEAGHYIVVIECPYTEMPELVIRADKYAEVLCACGIHV
jgi:hypothetical protein